MNWQSLETYDGKTGFFWFDNGSCQWGAFGVLRAGPGDKLRNVWWDDNSFGAEAHIRCWMPASPPDDQGDV